jgi:hypothetical protein
MLAAMSRFSSRTLTEFEDACSGLFLAIIDRAFEGAEISLGQSPKAGGGERRTRFRDYVASVDQRNVREVAKLADALGYILTRLESDDDAKLRFETLKRGTERDGFAYADGRLQAKSLLIAPVAEIDDLRHLSDDAMRLYSLAMEHPAEAIGRAKDLLESVCKTVLRLSGGPDPAKGADLVEVAKAAMKALDLVPAGVTDAKKGADIVRRCLQQLGAVVASLGDLRNAYGSGHGRDGKWKGLGPRHARLAVGAAVTVADFLVETYLERADNQPTTT